MPGLPQQGLSLVPLFPGLLISELRPEEWQCRQKLQQQPQQQLLHQQAVARGALVVGNEEFQC